MILGDDMSPAFDAVPGLRDLVPNSMGGDNKCTFEELCGKIISESILVLHSLSYLCHIDFCIPVYLSVVRKYTCICELLSHSRLLRLLTSIRQNIHMLLLTTR